MILEKLFENLALEVHPFATCRLAEGWRLLLPDPVHVTLHYILEGEGKLRVGSGEFLPLPTNALAIMPPGIEHAIQCGTVDHETGVEGQGDPEAALCELVAGPLDQVSLIVACGQIHATYAGGPGLFDSLREAIVLNFSDSQQMRGIFEALVNEYRRSGPASAAMMNALMNQCLIQVLRRVSRQADGTLPWLTALDDPRLARVVETILNHPERQHTLELLADVAHMSRSAFAEHFRQSFGRTPMDYLRDVRLRRGAQLLQVSQLSVDGVASKVGFASRSHFSRSFKEQFGCSPVEFRERRF
jgi:AraC-like DNA-binding protein